MDDERRTRMEAEHSPEAVRQRLENRHGPGYLGDAVLGGIDGCVTTFAVVAGAVGAGFSGLVIVVLGYANLLADGFSMAVSNYQGTKSQRQQVEEARRGEERQIEEIPEGEREEVRQIFAAKGAVLHRSALRSGLETLLTGGEAALLAYVVGAWLRAAFGAS
jgi:vacuolar iron transporter family protein